MSARFAANRRAGEPNDIYYARVAALRVQQVVNIWPAPLDSPFFVISDDETPDRKRKKDKKDKRDKKRREYSVERAPSNPADELESDTEIGPEPEVLNSIEVDTRDYGAMLKGEGAAYGTSTIYLTTSIAAYVQAGKRIPRRGEVGIDPEMFEKDGYVMSGNRNKHMEGVRQKKEIIVLTSEEKRAKFLLAQQERQKREADVMSNFKELVSDRMRQIEQKD